MTETAEKIVSYMYSRREPGNFPGWYEWHSFSAGSHKSPSNFDSLVSVWAEHLNRAENRDKRAVEFTPTPDEFTPEQAGIIKSLLQEHNSKIPELTKIVSGK